MMSPIEDALRFDFFPKFFVGEEISSYLREILIYSMKHRGIGIPDPWPSAERAYNASKPFSEVQVG